MYTVGRLARKFQLSRSTLLYYDSIGLLRPSSRTAAGYRLYSETEARRLESIQTFQRGGLTLADIQRILDRPGDGLGGVLERRLKELDSEIGALRRQQRVIIGLLKTNDLHRDLEVLDKETWVSLLAACGFTDRDMALWHVEFEKMAPEKHRGFLEYLGLPDDQIQAIRAWSAEKIEV